jgi:hypothetical protein
MYKRLLIGASALAVGSILVVAPGAQAGATRDRATGGGQTLVPEAGGAGSTIAFTAQNREPTKEQPYFATGQVQYIARTGGTGQGQEKFHGAVTCLAVTSDQAGSGTAVIEGELTKGATEDAPYFRLIVRDNGEPNQADLISFTPTDDAPACDEPSNFGDKPPTLARGNAQVYDYTAPEES